MRLPSLNALRAFEAAARHLSIQRAAGQLNVSPSAVSHRIRGLEADLGVALFRRENRGLALTEAGALLLPGLRDGFDRIAGAVAGLGARRRDGPLTVSMVSTFALRWFLPRLPRFQRRHPGIEIRLSTTTRTVDFEREGFDAAIRAGRGDWPGLRADRLFAIDAGPVCSPRLLVDGPPLATPRDLAGHTLLYAEPRAEDWAQWFASVGLARFEPARRLTFEATNFALEAALQGAGVAIAGKPFVAQDLALGNLIMPFDHTIRQPDAYYLACPEAWADSPKLAAFRDWLVEEARESV